MKEEINREEKKVNFEELLLIEMDLKSLKDQLSILINQKNETENKIISLEMAILEIKNEQEKLNIKEKLHMKSIEEIDYSVKEFVRDLESKKREETVKGNELNEKTSEIEKLKEGKAYNDKDMDQLAQNIKQKKYEIQKLQIDYQIEENEKLILLNLLINFRKEKEDWEKIVTDLATQVEAAKNELETANTELQNMIIEVASAAFEAKEAFQNLQLAMDAFAASTATLFGTIMAAIALAYAVWVFSRATYRLLKASYNLIRAAFRQVSATLDLACKSNSLSNSKERFTEANIKLTAAQEKYNFSFQKVYVS